MKEIKFRIWLKKHGEWKAADAKGMRCADLCVHYEDGFFTLKEADGWILEQGTGVKDKNGNEIFLGDIIKYEFGEGLVQVRHTEEGHDRHPAIIMNDTWVQGGEIEILGNIHENSNLLRN